MPSRRRIIDDRLCAHFVTFSVCRRRRLLDHDHPKRIVLGVRNEELRRREALCIGFVLMPDDFHLLVYATDGSSDPKRVSRLLGSIKRSCSVRVKEKLVAARSRLLDRLTIRERPGKTTFRFWQEGPGYDRNLQTSGGRVFVHRLYPHEPRPAKSQQDSLRLAMVRRPLASVRRESE